MNREPQRWLLAMKGIPGSGKSRLAGEIAGRTGWSLVDKDEAKDALHGTNSDAGRRAYQITLERVEEALRTGRSVICDSPLTFPSLYEEICAVAERTGVQAVVVECICPDDAELRRRIEERGEKRLARHRITDWNALLTYREQTAHLSNYPILLPHITAETTRPVSELADAVLQWLEGLNRELGAFSNFYTRGH